MHCLHVDFPLKDAVPVGVGEEGGSKPYQHFLVVKPQLTNDDCHPEEGVFLLVTEDIWREHMNSDGTIEDELQLRKVGHFRMFLVIATFCSS